MIVPNMLRSTDTSLKKNLNRKIIQFLFVQFEDQLADMLTKLVLENVFYDAINKLDMINIYTLT